MARSACHTVRDRFDKTPVDGANFVGFPDRRLLRSSGDGFVSRSLAGTRALIVGGRDRDAQFLNDMLARDGIIVTRARDEAQAPDLCATCSFDLVALSLSLTAHDPLQLVARLRANDPTRDIALLLLAEPEQKSRVLHEYDLGAHDWLIKPFDEDDFRGRARNQIRRKLYLDRLRADLGLALEMTLTDPLTGFYNRRYLTQHLRDMLNAQQQNCLAVMMIDVDHFKTINDRWGHMVGDDALRAVADQLRRSIRAFDSIVRYGGEEFALVMPSTGQPDAISAAERLRTAIAAMCFAPKSGVIHQLTVSIGIAWSDGRGMTTEQLLGTADAALYQAKRSGRNRVSFATTPVPKSPAWYSAQQNRPLLDQTGVECAAERSI